jgi:hypothetical protein
LRIDISAAGFHGMTAILARIIAPSNSCRSIGRASCAVCPRRPDRTCRWPDQLLIAEDRERKPHAGNLSAPTVDKVGGKIINRNRATLRKGRA